MSNYAPFSTALEDMTGKEEPLRENGAPQPRRGCRDAIWGPLFYGHVAVIAYLAAANVPAIAADVAQQAENGDGGNRFLRRFLEEDAAAADGNQEVEEFATDPSILLSLIGISAIAGLIVSTLALSFMMTFAETLVKVALWFNIILFGAMAMLSFFVGAYGSGMMMLFMSLFAAYYAYRVWSRIPFAAANLKTAVTAVRANLGLAFYAYWSLVLTFVWMILWSVSMVSTTYVLAGCDVEGVCEKDVNSGIMFLFFLSFYWTINVITNVVHVTTAGTVGTWWFRPAEAGGCCSAAVRDSYFRSLTTSFGSICLGSLIVALIQAARQMIKNARERRDSILACCADCLMGCIESLVEYFNKWAYVYVGIYGMSFMESGKQVMTLFRNRGWTSIVADMMIDTVLFMVSLGVGVLLGLVAVIVGVAAGMAQDATLGVAFFLGFLVGYAMCQTLFSIVSSAVNTVIVCYAEAPSEFEMNHPQLSANMRDSWRQAWPEEFGY